MKKQKAASLSPTPRAIRSANTRRQLEDPG